MGNAIIVSVESGKDSGGGNWVSEERNIHEDYKRAFIDEPPHIKAVAVLTDTDDTKDEVTA
jgi:hypothetical protein